MTFSTYAALTRHPVVRRVLVLGFVIRVPLWAVNVAITLHVVTHLHRSYAEAGVVSMVAAGALAISSPWRGGLLDRVGLRASVLPSLVTNAVAWSIAPFVGCWPLLGLVAVANLMAVPSFSIIRSVLIAAVSEEERTSVDIDGFATLEQVWKVTDWSRMEALAPQHIWNEEIVRERFAYDEDSCLHVALVRAWRLPQRWTFPYARSYGG